MELNPQYQIKKSLGKIGGFSNIFLGYDKEKKRDVIIKKIDRLKTTEELFDREINNMKKMKCINIVEYYDHYIDKDYYYIIMEKCDEDLYDFLEKNGPLSDLMIKNILIQLNKAFLAMRSNNIIHRDLKPENILIKYNSSNMNEFTIKLADFGASREYNKKSFSTHIGTQGYAAPELFGNSNYDPGKCDLWAIGVIIYQLKFNDMPILQFYSNNIPNKFENVELDDLMKKLIVVDQNKRISWEDYFNHDFFKINKNNDNNSQKIKIIIRDKEYQKTLIEINKSCKVSELKDIIKEKKLLNDEEFLIHCNGIILEDERTIDDYEIDDLACVIIVPTFRGG